MVCAQPPMQYVGVVLFIASLIHAAIESHKQYWRNDNDSKMPQL